MRGLLLTSVFAGALVITAAANVPLSFVLRHSGLAQNGVQWQQARGTIWHGQVTGMYAHGDAVGAVEGDFSFLRIVKGQPGHLLRWSGPYGHGSALAGVGANSLRIRNGQAAITFDVARISAVFPAQEVSLRLSNVAMDMDQDGCRTASGNVATDALASISAVYGAKWPELTGGLSCEQGKLFISVEGKASDGTQISAKTSLEGGGQLELQNVPDNQTNALLLAGFTNEAGRYVYTQKSPNGETSQ